MRRMLLGMALTLAAGALAPALAADHRDGPGVSADGTTDINDVYAWMSADASKVYLTMTVAASATTASKFSNAALYVFHVNAFKAYGDTMPVRHTVVCRFDAAQKISCWGPDASGEYVTGDASATAGLATTSGKMKVFAGLRDDPFFFNIAGFRAAIGGAKQALMMEPKACPKAAEPAAPSLAGLLSKDGAGGAGKDGFAKGGDAVMGGYSGNVLAIVVAIDKALVTDADHKLLGVWGSTNMAK